MDREMLKRLASYPLVTVSWITDDGYPSQTPAALSFDAGSQRLLLRQTGLPIPVDREINVVGSHIRPQPGWGYDQRRYISVWGRATEADGELVLRPERTWGWDEQMTPFFEYVERSNRQAHRYLQSLSQERGVPVKPRLSPVWTFLLATRLPFLTATLVPILLGIAVAANDGFFNLGFAALTLLAGAAIHIGLNVANDVFDGLSGADDANYRPTQFSGGSRVIQRGLLSLPQMAGISIAAYAVGAGLGLLLVIERGSLELLLIGIAGLLISVFYTAPPLRLVHRGLGEVTTGLGFGPVMVLGAYVVQAQRLSWEALVASIPVGILIALVLYVNEIPDRESDASVGKRTLPARLPQDTVVRGFLFAAVAAFAVVTVGAVSGVLPLFTLIALAALPLVFRVYRGIRENYDRPYDMMAAMGRNVQLHLLTGLLLFAGYMVAVAAG